MLHNRLYSPSSWITVHDIREQELDQGSQPELHFGAIEWSRVTTVIES
jgi:hypothetical protein